LAVIGKQIVTSVAAKLLCMFRWQSILSCCWTALQTFSGWIHPCPCDPRHPSSPSAWRLLLLGVSLAAEQVVATTWQGGSSLLNRSPALSK